MCAGQSLAAVATSLGVESMGIKCDLVLLQLLWS